MANSFSKEERVAFESLLEGFQDALVMSRNVAVYNTDQTMMERTGDVIWRPQPYIAVSYFGSNAGSNFKDVTQLAVPSSITIQRHVPWVFNARELRDMLQEGRISQAAEQRLASDINQSVIDVASFQGSIFIKRPTATGFDDIAVIEAAMNERGIPFEDRKLVLSTRDYNALASDLQKASRSFGNQISDKALRKSFLGEIASFETFKADYLRRKVAAAGGSITISTLDGASNYNPKATSAAITGEISNVDNRFQTVTVSSTTNVVAGDAFTIANVNQVHMITKEDTGILKTFRVVKVLDGGTTMVITPPIISNQVANEAAEQYQNCVVNAKSGTAAIVWLNTAVSFMNPFWVKDTIEILPGRLAVPGDAGAAVMRATTDNGVEVVMQKQFDINTQTTKYRLDTLYGIVNKNPDMSGVVMFNQS
jgi:hypothetical protein